MDSAMMEEQRHLEELLRQIREKLDTVETAIIAGDQEIENMHTYYWENYTEMDEYGYENYDNQQALLSQVNANEEQRLIRHRLRRMLDSPYFARVDFRYAGESAPESYYIGIANFARQAGAVPLIFDWRAPVSGLFYDYDKGPAEFETPGGTVTGEITSKRQYQIKHGKLLYAFESDIKIDDDILKAELGSNSDVKLKNIVRTIQREQNRIIRNTKDRILVVQGAAGSGKTSIALHRIAYLLYHDRNQLQASNVLVLTPNGVFADYISRILPELGEENVNEMSFDLFAYKELKDVAEDCEDKYDAIEAMLAQEPAYEERYHYKGSRAFAEAINRFVLELESDLVDFRDVSYQKLSISKEKICRLFYEKFPETPLLSRMKMVMDYAVDETETLTGRDFNEEELYFIRELFMGLYRTRDLYELYNRFLEREGLQTLPDQAKEERKIPYEDVWPMLYMKYQLETVRKRQRIRHLVIDEMQDYSYLQYLVIDKLFSCKMTILGDFAQTIDGEMQDVTTFLPKIFGKDLSFISMRKSYRNTYEIGRYANSLIGNTEIELLKRHGAEPVELRFSTMEEALAEVIERVKNYETMAVICMSAAEAWMAYEWLAARVKAYPVHYLDKNSSRFQSGITVTTFYLAKGLEFDQVFAIYEQDTDTPLYRQAKYIAATRALHELYMFALES